MLWTNLQTTTAWLDANLEQFDPLPTGFLSYRSIKRFAELSIALMCIERLSRSSDGCPWLGNWVQRVTEFLTLNCGKPAYLEGLIKDPLGAFNFSLPYLVLKRMGYRCTALDSVIERLLRDGLFLSVEMVPFRALDRLYFLKIGGRPTNPRDLVHWYRKTTIGARKGAAVFNVEDTYSVTHTVFYMSDFGSDAKSLLNPVETARVLIILRSLLVHSWRIKNWDLLGEVLAGMICLGVGREDQLVHAAEQAYLQVYRPDGTMPPDREVERRQRRKLRNLEGDYFRDCYHSTLVFTLFAAMSLQRDAR